ncbi:hypothetical protein J2X20_002820 [Pelomonas saccharophila]|uniref:SGNH/GDSL hydrolase family protein n=1 Tax=Roseateles saccharophilus TaxID=304 RepID=A0ABU1YMT2_ROSSA|nr:hypothetical protein [Roseateles saccharophilus]MDR7270162.1 hypothetical protein [Roseateles saccharophilus]
MSRICCIGSSHLGALKGGWDSISPERPGVDIVFFGAPNYKVEESLQFLTLEGRRIVPTAADVTHFFEMTSGGLSHIELDAYDAFIVMGGIGLTKPFDLYTLFRTDEQTHQPAHVLVGSDCLVEAFVGIFRSTLPYRLTTALAQLTGRPVFLVPEPRPSEALLAAEGTESPHWDVYIKRIQQLHAHADHLPLARHYEAAMAAVQQRGVTLVDAPPDLVVDGIFTPHRFCRDSVWLQGHGYEKSPRNDFFHMNQDFGAAVLNRILGPGA